MKSVLEDFLSSSKKHMCFEVTNDNDFDVLAKECSEFGFIWRKSNDSLLNWSPYYSGNLSEGESSYLTLHKGERKTVSYSTSRDLVIGKYKVISQIPVCKKACAKCSCDSNKKGISKTGGQKMSKLSGIMGQGLGFGVYEGGKIGLSMFGIAFKNQNGTMISYNKQTEELVDVDDFTFDLENAIFKMPTRIDQLVKGDYILYKDVPYIVKDVRGKDITGINMKTQANSSVKYANNMFGFNFVTKLITLMDMNGEGNQMGNMLMPMLLMGDGKKDDMMTMMMLSGAMGGNTDTSNIFSNPMMLMALAGKDGDNDSLKTMMMMSMFSGGGNAQNPFENMFQQTPVSKPVKAKAVKTAKAKKPAKVVESEDTDTDTVE